MKCAGWGAEVLYESCHAVHASGHAHREELRDMLYAARPEIFCSRAWGIPASC